MSMISAQIDELCELAGDGSMEWVAGPIRASVLRDAADTIWELRDDLQRANAAAQDAEHDESRAWDRVRKAEAENARLRSELESVGIAAYSYGRGDLKAENAKLRMLIDLKQTCWKYVGWCSECPYNGLDDEHGDCNCTVREKVNSLARELGIEVDG